MLGAGIRVLFWILFATLGVASANPLQGTPFNNQSGASNGREPVSLGPTVQAEAARSIIETAPTVPTVASDVFGAQLFTGAFSRNSYSGFNPNYSIGIGDSITLKMWGAYELETVLTVDAQGNIFVPRVGPVNVVGVRNSELGEVVKRKIATVYRSNVHSYVNLAAAQPVKIFVTGFVARPGLYAGLSSDSVLNYLDQAGGVDPDRGSYIDIRIQRGDANYRTIDLYAFLLDGRMPDAQLADGDTIVVGPRRSTVKVSGLVQNDNRFEFPSSSIALDEILALAKAQPSATHLRVIRNTGTTRNVEYYSLDEARAITVVDGDAVQLTADKRPGTITVRVEGEHQSPQEFVLPHGSRLGELMRSVHMNERSDARAIQLYRESVKVRQAEMLEQSLRALEHSVLTAHSATNSEIELRKGEAELVLKWIERARGIAPRGQVVLAQTAEIESLLLENGDVIKVPVEDGIVLISGAVMFPNATVYNDRLSLSEYIDQAGGYAQSAKNSQIVILHRNGSFTRASEGGWGREPDARIRPGDEILVMPKVDVKSVQITKDLTQILYQIAVSAAVVIGL
ncbi:MAG: polysaccharide biosynthesis/export family protein [Thiotrichales bacterium]